VHGAARGDGQQPRPASLGHATGHPDHEAHRAHPGGPVGAVVVRRHAQTLRRHLVPLQVPAGQHGDAGRETGDEQLDRRRAGVPGVRLVDHQPVTPDGDLEPLPVDVTDLQTHAPIIPDTPGVDADEWDRRYAAADLVWGAGPNRYVEAELADEPPGQVLDVGCGEGRNAIWLATRGWRAVGLDFSAVAIERGRRLATQAGVGDDVTLAVADVVRDAWPEGPFDAVVLAYLHLAAADRRTVLRRAARALAPGGLLVVVGHDSTNLTDGVGGPQDPDVLFTADDVLADLDGLGLAVRRSGSVRRPVPGAPRDAVDALVTLRA
jgi:SAM-dependent methyltransferase